MNYTSIKNVLFNLSTLIPESEWNERYFLEWCLRGLRSVHIEKAFTTKVSKLSVLNHKASLPNDYQYVVMAAIKPCENAEDVSDYIKEEINLLSEEDNPAMQHMAEPEHIVDRIQSLYLQNTSYRAMKRATSPFMQAIHCTDDFWTCTTCSEDYEITPDGAMTTSAKYGIVLLSYLTYPTTDDGDFLIPDYEPLKDAIEAYCMYRFYAAKAVGASDASFLKVREEREYWLAKFNNLSMAAMNLNLPDLDTMENMSNLRNRLVPRLNFHDKFFTQLGYKEETLY